MEKIELRAKKKAPWNVSSCDTSQGMLFQTPHIQLMATPQLGSPCLPCPTQQCWEKRAPLEIPFPFSVHL